MADEITTKKSDDSLTLGAFAPEGTNPKAWVKLLQQQLFASKNHQPTMEEMIFYAQTCQATGLNPARREIYAIYRKVDGVPKLTIQTGIDGMRSVAERSGKYGGSKEPEFTYDPDNPLYVSDYGKDKLVPNKAKVTVLKVVNGIVLETTRTANWADYYPGESKLGTMYRRFPEVMLAKCAEAQALRAAFPNLGQIYEESEISDNEVQPVQADEDEKAKAIAEAKKSLMEGESDGTE